MSSSRHWQMVWKYGTLGQRRAHDDSAHAGGSLEVSLAALSPAGVQAAVDLRHVGGVGRRLS